MDADEIIDDPKKLLFEIEKAKDPSIGGFLIERTDIYRHKKNGLIIHYPIGIVRIFRNNLHFHYAGTVHEQINTSIVESGYRISIIKKTKIIHQVHFSDDLFLEEKQKRYLQLINTELTTNPSNFWLQYQKAKTYWFLEMKDEAKKLFSEIANDKNCPLVIRCSGFCNLGVLLNEENQFEKALIEVEKSLKLNPHQSLGMMVKGNIYYQNNEFGKSIKAFRKVKTRINKLKFDQIIPGDLYARPEELKYKIACCYLAAGKTMAGKFLLKRALKINNVHVPSLLLLAKIYAAKNKIGFAREMTNKCLALNPGWKQAEDFLQSLNTRCIDTDIID